MATSNATTVCYTCKEETTTYSCPGCSKYFCFDDLAGHRESLKPQFHQIEDQRNEFAETLGGHKNHANSHPLVTQITQWEKTSIEKIQKTAKEQRQMLQQSLQDHTQNIEAKFDSFTKEMQTMAKTKDFNETVLNKLRTQLEGLKKQLDEPVHIQIKEDSSTTYIRKLSITITAAQEQSSVYSDKQLDCKGHACAKCGCCRDWYWRPNGDGKNYTQRPNATCNYALLLDDDYYHYSDDGGGGGLIIDPLCECRDNQS